MCPQLKSILAGVLCSATALGVPPPRSLAGPMSVTPPSAVTLAAPAEAFHYRRHYYRYRAYPADDYGYDPGGAIFAGAALGLMGAGIAAATAPRWGGGWGGGWGPGW